MFDAKTPYLPAPPPDATSPSPNADDAFIAVRVEPVTSSLYDVLGLAPIPTVPLALTTNCDVSGFALSSTTKALPVPVCVILTKSVVVEADASICPVTLSVLPSNVRLLSTVALGAEPFSVMTPLSVVPVRLSRPAVPLDPEEPDEPEDPELPVDPLLPDVPEEPLVPDDPEDPLVPDDPTAPVSPLSPVRTKFSVSFSPFDGSAPLKFVTGIVQYVVLFVSVPVTKNWFTVVPEFEFDSIESIPLTLLVDNPHCAKKFAILTPLESLVFTYMFATEPIVPLLYLISPFVVVPAVVVVLKL